MPDSEMLDAIGDYGLCVAAHDVLSAGDWERTWVCQSGELVYLAPSIREAITGTVQLLQKQGATRH